MDGAPSITLGIWVENGSRFERRDQAGISHFLEHVLFKGTERRTASQIAEEIDAVGGVLNAFTGKECTCYYARVLAENFELAADVLGDLFLHSVFDAEEIDRERGVILQEISQGEDSPEEHIHDLFSLAYWPDHPLSFPICGRGETVRSFGRENFLQFVAARYCPDRLVIAAAGQIDHDVLHAWVEKNFGELSGAAEEVNGGLPRATRGFHRHEKALEQVHLCIGAPSVSLTSDRRFAAYVLNTLLGGGMSSRLFQEIRERRGRAYSVYSFLSSYRDAGYFGVYVGTSAEWIDEVLEVVLRELAKIARDGIDAEELRRTKGQMKGNMLLGLETSDSRMSRLAKNEIYFGRYFPLSEVAELVDATTSDEIVALAEQTLAPETMAVSLLGDVGGEKVDESVFNGS
jgi:predicted Zn-dependent peptidase